MSREGRVPVDLRTLVIGLATGTASLAAAGMLALGLVLSWRGDNRYVCTELSAHYLGYPLGLALLAVAVTIGVVLWTVVRYRRNLLHSPRVRTALVVADVALLFALVLLYRADEQLCRQQCRSLRDMFTDGNSSVLLMDGRKALLEAAFSAEHRKEALSVAIRDEFATHVRDALKRAPTVETTEDVHEHEPAPGECATHLPRPSLFESGVWDLTSPPPPPPRKADDARPLFAEACWRYGASFATCAAAETACNLSCTSDMVPWVIGWLSHACDGRPQPDTSFYRLYDLLPQKSGATPLHVLQTLYTPTASGTSTTTAMGIEQKLRAATSTSCGAQFEGALKEAESAYGAFVKALSAAHVMTAGELCPVPATPADPAKLVAQMPALLSPSLRQCILTALLGRKCASQPKQPDLAALAACERKADGGEAE